MHIKSTNFNVRSKHGDALTELESKPKPVWLTSIFVTYNDDDRITKAAPDKTEHPADELRLPWYPFE